MVINESQCHLIDDPNLWDSFVEHSHYEHLLQSYRWGEFKGYFGWEPERVGLEREGKLVAGAQVLYHPIPLGSVAYVPKGPVLDPKEPQLLGTLLESLHKLARSRGAIFLKIEPNIPIGEALIAQGFRPAPPVQAKSTIIVDLSPDLEAISAKQKSKTRYNIGLAARRGVKVREGSIDELPIFSQLMKITSERDKFNVRSLSYFQKLMETLGDKTRLFLASYEDEVLAGILVSVFGEEASYLYGASSNVHRNLMPTYLLQWEAMKWAKAQGCTRYDLWGIPEVLEGGPDEVDEASKPSRQPSGDSSLEGAWGLYRFKGGFGGQVVNCPGAFDYVYSPLRYWVWTKVVPKVLGARRRLGD